MFRKTEIDFVLRVKVLKNQDRRSVWVTDSYCVILLVIRRWWVGA